MLRAQSAYARFVDGEGRIERIVSNYSRISFNFGPTLLAWMKEKAPDIHQAVVAADQESRQRFSGHGSALAQCYNHIILPLANRRDKFTQVLWGRAILKPDSAARPRGCGCRKRRWTTNRWTSSPSSASSSPSFRPSGQPRAAAGGGDWHDVSGGRVDPSMPYLVKLPSGRSIAVFFYDGPIARAVAFEGLLSNGQSFAQPADAGASMTAAATLNS